MIHHHITLLIDIDGCLIFQDGPPYDQFTNRNLLEGVKEKFAEWDKIGYRIILITARKESTRETTIKQLSSLGLFWDELIMGATGQRFLINDLKPHSQMPTAVAINIPRNEGLSDINLEEAAKNQLSIYSTSA